MDHEEIGSSAGGHSQIQLLLIGGFFAAPIEPVDLDAERFFQLLAGCKRIGINGMRGFLVSDADFDRFRVGGGSRGIGSVAGVGRVRRVFGGGCRGLGGLGAAGKHTGKHQDGQKKCDQFLCHFRSPFSSFRLFYNKHISCLLQCQVLPRLTLYRAKHNTLYQIFLDQWVENQHWDHRQNDDRILE